MKKKSIVPKKKVEASEFQACPRCNHRQGLYFSRSVRAWKCQFCTYDESSIQQRRIITSERETEKIKQGMKVATGETDD